MKMEITEKKANPLFDRTEIRYTADHAGESTPTKAAVVDEIAKLMKAKKETVVLCNVDTVYGSGISKGYAKVYGSKESAQKFEQEYLLKRNGLQKPAYVAPAKSAEE